MSKIREQLESTPYHGLKAKFEELGILEFWGSGVKKVDLVNRAARVLEKIESDDSLSLENLSEIKKILAKEDEEIAEKESLGKDYEHKKAVEAIVANKKHWTIESMQKRIKSYGNVFSQHRGTPKGEECLNKQLALQEAFEIIFKK